MLNKNFIIVSYLITLFMFRTLVCFNNSGSSFRLGSKSPELNGDLVKNTGNMVKYDNDTGFDYNKLESLISIVKKGFLDCLNFKREQKACKNVLNKKNLKYDDFGIIIFNLVLAFLDQENLINLRLVNKDFEKKIDSFSLNFKPIKFNEVNPDNVFEFNEWLSRNCDRICFCVKLKFCDVSEEEKDCLLKEDTSLIIQVLKGKIKEICLFNLDLNNFDLIALKDSGIRKLRIKSCENIKEIFFNRFLAESITSLTISGSGLTDKYLFNLPKKLVNLDVSKPSIRVFHASSLDLASIDTIKDKVGEEERFEGKFISNLPVSIKKLKLGEGIEEKYLFEANKDLKNNLEKLCIRRTKISNFEFLKEFIALKKVCVNKRFKNTDIKYLPQGLESIFIDNVFVQPKIITQDFSEDDFPELMKRYIEVENTEFAGGNFKDFPVSLRSIKFNNLKSLESKFFKDMPKNFTTIYLKDEYSDIVNTPHHKNRIVNLNNQGFRVKNFAGMEYKKN